MHQRPLNQPPAVTHHNAAYNHTLCEEWCGVGGGSVWNSEPELTPCRVLPVCLPVRQRVRSSSPQQHHRRIRSHDPVRTARTCVSPTESARAFRPVGCAAMSVGERTRMRRVLGAALSLLLLLAHAAAAPVNCNTQASLAQVRTDGAGRHSKRRRQAVGEQQQPRLLFSTRFESVAVYHRLSRISFLLLLLVPPLV